MLLTRKTGLRLCLFSATLMGGSLQSTVAFAATGAMNAYRGLLSPGNQILFDYELAEAGFSIAGLCHVPLPGDGKKPSPQTPCHAAGLCSARKSQTKWKDALLDC